MSLFWKKQTDKVASSEEENQSEGSQILEPDNSSKAATKVLQNAENDPPKISDPSMAGGKKVAEDNAKNDHIPSMEDENNLLQPSAYMEDSLTEEGAVTLRGKNEPIMQDVVSPSEKVTAIVTTEAPNSPAVSYEKPDQNEETLPSRMPVNDAQDTIFLTWLFKYGCISEAQRQNFLATNSALNPSLRDTLSILQINAEDIYLHTEKSLEKYAIFTGIPAKDLQKALVLEKFEEDIIPEILPEIDILLTLEMFCKRDDQCQLFDWISARNYRKKRMLKIKRCDGKRGSIKPDLLVILKKKRLKCGILFNSISATNAFSAGERLAKSQELLMACNAWLSSSEKIEDWLKKRNLYLPVDSVVIALLLNSDQTDMAEDLLELCISLDIKTPIFIADRNMFLQHPFLCWHTNCDSKNIFLKAKKKKL